MILSLVTWRRCYYNGEYADDNKKAINSQKWYQGSLSRWIPELISIIPKHHHKLIIQTQPNNNNDIISLYIEGLLSKDDFMILMGTNLKQQKHRGLSIIKGVIRFNNPILCIKASILKA